jgi:LemA protein
MKITWIIVVFAVVLVLSFGAGIVSANNTAINYEETLKSSKSGISVQELRQHDLILELVQVAEQSAAFEKATQTDIAKLRSGVDSAQSLAEAKAIFAAFVEAYPDLKTIQTYTQLMTEMSVSANLVTQYRDVYTDNVKNYVRFVRQFPNRLFLEIAGYQVQTFEYISPDASETILPADLFGNH